MENLDPPPSPPPPNQGWENGAFLPSSGARLHPWFEGDGGLLFHFIFSKIVACSRIWDWVESAESRKRKHENKTGGNFSPHGRLFACLSLSRFPTILEPGTSHELPRKRTTLPTLALTTLAENSTEAQFSLFAQKTERPSSPVQVDCWLWSAKTALFL